jgi:hypothetical protein
LPTSQNLGVPLSIYLLFYSNYISRKRQIIELETIFPDLT